MFRVEQHDSRTSELRRGVEPSFAIDKHLDSAGLQTPEHFKGCIKKLHGMLKLNASVRQTAFAEVAST